MKKGLLTKKDTLLYSLHKMDSEMLATALEDDCTYQDLSKEAFIEKLSNIFLIFKRYGNTRLKLFQGKCVGTGCPNIDCTGYTLKGEKSDCYLNLIIKEEDKIIIDIFHCKDFACKEVKKNINEEMSITIWEDEKANFIPSIEYLAKLQHFEKAYSEIINDDEPIIIGAEAINYWMEKHKDLYEPIKYKSRLLAYVRFARNYESLGYYVDLLQYSDECKNGLTNIHDLINTNNLTDKNRLNWLMEYEELGNHKIAFWDSSTFDIIDKRIIKLRLNEITVSLDYLEFESVFTFENTFKSQLWETLRLYGDRFKDGYTCDYLEDILKGLWEEMSNVQDEEAL